MHRFVISLLEHSRKAHSLVLPFALQEWTQVLENHQKTQNILSVRFQQRFSEQLPENKLVYPSPKHVNSDWVRVFVRTNRILSSILF